MWVTMFGKIKSIFNVIGKILNYDICKIPNNLSKFYKTHTFLIVLFSFWYIVFSVATIGLLIRLGQYSVEILVLVYFWSVIFNFCLIKKRRYLFYLDKHNGHPLNSTLFTLCGPFGMLKAMYLNICIRPFVTLSNYKLVVGKRDEIWRALVVKDPNYIRNSESIFLDTLAKFQRRLKGQD